MEAVVLCGVPGSGKSTLYLERFFETHVRISQEMLRAPHREARFLDVCVNTRQPFVVDRVNATPDDRAAYLRAAKQGSFRAIAYVLDIELPEAVARNARRPEREQAAVEAILAANDEFVVPTTAEGFDEVWRAWADGEGSFRLERRDPPASEPRFTRSARARR